MRLESVPHLDYRRKSYKVRDDRDQSGQNELE
jgi:hypothetical protein